MINLNFSLNDLLGSVVSNLVLKNTDNNIIVHTPKENICSSQINSLSMLHFLLAFLDLLPLPPYTLVFFR